MTVPFQIKICGVTTVADARVVQQSGADAVGLNFYAPSPRSVDVEQARRLRDCFSAGVAVVGLFVNAPAAEVNEIAEQLQLDYIQLHGDESPEYMADITAAPIIRALRCGPERAVATAVDYVERCLAACGQTMEPKTSKSGLCAVLLDAYLPGKYGGGGKRLAASTFIEITRHLPLPTILAGGLTPENVADAIVLTGAQAVDTASGVERAPGEKDSQRLTRFVEAARRAFQNTTSLGSAKK